MKYLYKIVCIVQELILTRNQEEKKYVMKHQFIYYKEFSTVFISNIETTIAQNLDDEKEFLDKNKLRKFELIEVVRIEKIEGIILK